MQKQMALSDKHQILLDIGLSPSAANCYLCLALSSRKWLQAGEIGKLSGMKPTSLYRSLQELRIIGFLQTMRVVTATRYRAEPLSYALDNLAAHQRQRAQPLIQALNDDHDRI